MFKSKQGVADSAYGYKSKQGVADAILEYTKNYTTTPRADIFITQKVCIIFKP